MTVEVFDVLAEDDWEAVEYWQLTDEEQCDMVVVERWLVESEGGES